MKLSNGKVAAVAALAISAIVATSGCSIVGSATGANQTVAIENVTITLAPGRTIALATQLAAIRRKWIPQTMEDGTIRCTIVQRSSKVVVDVVPMSENSFSIRKVESNLSNRKYNKWAMNLCREIIVKASR